MITVGTLLGFEHPQLTLHAYDLQHEFARVTLTCNDTKGKPEPYEIKHYKHPKFIFFFKLIAVLLYCLKQQSGYISMALYAIRLFYMESQVLSNCFEILDL